METTCNQHHRCVLEGRQTNNIRYCFLFLSGVAFLSSRKWLKSYFKVFLCVSQIHKLRWIWGPRNMASTVTIKITFPCHAWLLSQLTSNTIYFPVPMQVAFMSLTSYLECVIFKLCKLHGFHVSQYRGRAHLFAIFTIFSASNIHDLFCSI